MRKEGLFVAEARTIPSMKNPAFTGVYAGFADVEGT